MLFSMPNCPINLSNATVYGQKTTVYGQCKGEHGHYLADGHSSKGGAGKDFTDALLFSEIHGRTHWSNVLISPDAIVSIWHINAFFVGGEECKL